MQWKWENTSFICGRFVSSTEWPWVALATGKLCAHQTLQCPPWRRFWTCKLYSSLKSTEGRRKRRTGGHWGNRRKSAEGTKGRASNRESTERRPPKEEHRNRLSAICRLHSLFLGVFRSFSNFLDLLSVVSPAFRAFTAWLKSLIFVLKRSLF